MKVKEFIEILKDYPQEAELSFRVGSSQMSQDAFAKLQLMTGDGLGCLGFAAIETWREYDEKCPEYAGLLSISLVDTNYEPIEWRDYEIEFDSLTKGVKFPR